MKMVKSAKNDWKKIVHSQYDKLHRRILRTKLVGERELFDALNQQRNIAKKSLLQQHDNYQQYMIVSVIAILCVVIGMPLAKCLIEHTLGIRCFVPNNYLVWEATRPISDCRFCAGITGPRILPNITSEQFLVMLNDFVLIIKLI